MGDDEAWPPKSAYAALMSSPDGRKKVADLQAGLRASPIKRAPGTPSLLDRLRLARQGDDGAGIEGGRSVEVDGDDDEDEETLRLKLAAIEARLRLKKLQKVKKVEEPHFMARSRSALDEATNTKNSGSLVEVPLSPSKRRIISAESRSPNRVILGIDKGRKAADVSLRRAETVTGSPLKKRRYNEQVMGRSSSVKSKPNSSHARNADAIKAVKSFSERMAQTREKDKEQAEKRERVHRSRKKNLGLDQEELDKYKAASLAHSKDSSLPARSGKNSAKKKETTYSRSEIVNASRMQSGSATELSTQQGDASLFEGFSELHLSTRILPHAFLKRTFPEDRFTIYKVPDLLRDVTSPAYELPDEVCDFVVFGIIASKSQPLDQRRRADDNTKSSDASNMKWDDGLQNEKKFIVLNVTDLRWTIDLFLFDTAVPRYHRLSVGTVVAIVNPTIMRPKRGREDTGAFSMSLHNSEDTVLEIGQARDIGFCKALRKDERECGSWVDGSKTEICEFHLNLQIAKTQAARMGVNTGANGFGRGPNNRSNVFDPRMRSDTPGTGRGLLPTPLGRAYNWETGSHYYIAGSTNSSGAPSGPPKFRSGMSAATMLDLDVDDPFIAEGQLSRDREARIQKRMADQEKEREIAVKLGKFRSISNAGAEYMRVKSSNDSNNQHGNRAGSGTSTQGPKSDGAQNITDLRLHIGRKRAAQDVQLSPVKKKKTRFLTSTGIKEAGRESMGTTNRKNTVAQEDDDDDLDII